jgi:DNA polymerase
MRWSCAARSARSHERASLRTRVRPATRSADGGLVTYGEMLEEMGLAPVYVRREASGQGQGGGGVVAREASVGGDERIARIARLGLDALAADVAACTACRLCKTRQRAVPGVGDAHADWLFVGEAPGAEEDARGEPFVGQAGKLLDAMLAALELDRTRNVYIANVLKCRPPNNRTPEPVEASACEPYLARQIELIAPKIIVALGKSAATLLLGTEAPIASLRGRVHRHRGVPLVVTYHPAYLLRNLTDKSKAWDDLLLARRTVAAA